MTDELRIMESLNRVEEGINDPHIFKAMFMAGGPGSGKSFIASKLFKGSGLKFVNSDIPFEVRLKKMNLPMDIDPSKTAVYNAQSLQRSIAKGQTKARKETWVNGMLGLVIDGTGKQYKKITEQATALKAVGYDVGMTFINTTLQVALDRNEARDRTVPVQVVEKSWKAVQENMGKFQNFFGSGNFLIVDNSKNLDSKGVKELGVILARASMKWLGQPNKNPIGNKIIDILQSTGGKTLDDLSKAHAIAASACIDFLLPLLDDLGYGS